MPKYIDADKFLQDNAYFADRDFVNPKYDDTLRDLIDRAPAADVEPVIRCRDCKNSFMCDPGGIRCTKILNNGKYMPVEGDFFCAYGAKMDEEDAYGEKL